MIAYGHELQEIYDFFENKGVSIDGKFIAKEFEKLGVTGYLVFDEKEKCDAYYALLEMGNTVTTKIIEHYNRNITQHIIPPINPNIAYDEDIVLIRDMKREGAYIDALVKCIELLEEGVFCENLCMSIYKILACTGQTNNALTAVTIAIQIAKSNGQSSLLMNDEMHKDKLLTTIEDENAFKDYLQSISGQNDYILILPYKYSYDALVNQYKCHK